ncbi:MAG: ribosomal protein L22/L17 [Candidatus Parvarchaeum acidophilus ARMAN-5]|jgi:ribosomal protein L22|uniref:50S ribosomal protein L22 n=1 Tax=Candidatus Parvarchaeum acidophilus ARMAN-5 TaxID=662762 RepID=D6GW06_PARA5|nr:MAG: ribosomal protein L22/L17 [Candidatus Parvarchaeum acidophilus ARMAN-5]
MAENKNSKDNEKTAVKDKAARPITRVQIKREGMPISLKHTHEIMEAVKGKDITKAVNKLNKVLLKEDYIPFKKYPSKGHKHGIPAGFPQKATKQVINMLKELKSNAKNMGFDDSNIIISGYLLGRGGYPRLGSGSVYRHGKRTNLVIYSFVDQERKIVQKKTEALSEGNEKKTEDKTVPKVENKEDKQDIPPNEPVKEEEKPKENDKSENNNDLKAEN